MFFNKELIEYCHKAAAQGFVSSTDGNLSVRTKTGTFLITASAVNKGDIEHRHILEMDSEGNLVKGAGKVSTENKLHRYIYEKRRDVRAVVHCHPVYATAFASCGAVLDIPVFPEVVLTLGRIPLCRYSTPSTDELHKSLDPFIDYANVFLLENHGAVTVGKSLKEAYYRMEKLEHAAKTIYLANSMGGVKTIAPDKLRELYDIAESHYGIKLHDKNKFPH